jgi:hypothetical protein
MRLLRFARNDVFFDFLRVHQPLIEFKRYSLFDSYLFKVRVSRVEDIVSVGIMALGTFKTAEI